LLRTMTKAFLLCCVLVSAGYAAPPQQASSPVASEEDKGASSRAMSRCLVKATVRIDDRVSDARTIAGAAQQACKIEADRFYQLQLQGQPDLQVQMLKESVPMTLDQMAVDIVLLVRGKPQER
jgi:hypothetical protein